MYDSRISFHADGDIEPVFGFGNNDGTFSNRTHWHHNYWRMDFDIDGAGGNMVSTNGVDQTTEFHGLRGAPGSTTWEVRNTASGRGYRLVPGANDYNTTANESGRGFHTVDFMATLYVANEYGDNPNYSLSDCAMNQNALVNGASIDNQDVVLWYRVSVRDSTANNWPPGCSGGSCVPQDSMVCKTAGPRIEPFGPWGADTIFINGFESP
jgi:Cu2+-containing amine oxidase